MTTVDPRTRAGADTVVDGRAQPLIDTLKAYVALTKPRIIELLLVTTVPTMMLADSGLPSLGLVALTLLGGALAAGSANTFNCVIDRDIDAVMHRTENRPLATGALSVRSAVVFGSVLGLLSAVTFAVWVNILSAVLALAAIAFYVVVYTMVLKRRTSQNIVWGGAAGCMPVLIGWAAVRDGLGWAPLVLFGVVFLWTPPHYWPLAMRYRADYAAAHVPMLPVVASDRTVARQIVAYSWAMVGCSLLLWPIADTTWLYAGAAVVLGAAFLTEAHRLARRVSDAVSGPELAPMRLFHGSITYLTLLFLAVALDALVR